MSFGPSGENIAASSWICPRATPSLAHPAAVHGDAALLTRRVDGEQVPHAADAAGLDVERPRRDRQRVDVGDRVLGAS